MSDSKRAFTPGPWFCDGRTIHGSCGRLIATGRPAIFNENAASREQAESDLRLLSIAPILLAQLESAVSHIGALYGALDDLAELGATVAICGATYSHEAAHAAIAKALGADHV